MNAVAVAASTMPATGMVMDDAEPQLGAIATATVVTGIITATTLGGTTLGDAASSVVAPAIEIRERASVTELLAARSRAIAS